MLPFQKLDAWRLSHELAALSIPTNIAEGQAKRGLRELRRYLDISLGSFSETTYLLIFARDCGILPPERWEALEPKRRRVGLLLWRFYQGVARTADQP